MHQDSVSLENIKVILVEDSHTQALQLQQSLEANKLSVVVAHDGVEALEKLKEYSPDIIICDIEMPRMDGYEFCRHVKNSDKLKDIPVIILTNLSETMDVIKGIECGADGFMTKPYDLKLLLANIADVLGNKKILTNPVDKKPISIFLSGQEYHLTVNQRQIISLLLSTYSNAIYKNLELEKTYRQLNTTNFELEKKNNELQKLNKEKNQFLGMAAHDLRNPLSVIEGYSTLLQERLRQTIEEDSKKMLGNIQRSSAFMLNLINDLLNISAIESGKVVLNLRKVDLIELTKELLVFQDFIAQKKQIRLNATFQTQMLEVQCDSGKIAQVVSNLIGNAIKFSDRGKEVEIIIGLNKTSDMANITIKDHGMGISPEDIESIFKPFVKGKSKGTSGEIGTGLGLAIVNKIVEAHHGSIRVESELGKGSTFFVSLPVLQENI